MNSWYLRWLLLGGMTINIVACNLLGGIDRGGGIGTGDDSEQNTTTVAVGTINGFGSIIIDGQRYDTDNASFQRHGMSASQQAFGIGETVSVIANHDDNTFMASTVVFEPLLSGRVDAYDETLGVMTILGQRVQLSPETFLHGAFDPYYLVGEDVTVSGWRNSNTIDATSVAPQSQSVTESEISGIIQNLNAQASTFNLNALAVDFSSITHEPVAFQNGDWVTITGEQKDNIFYATSAVKKQLPAATSEISDYQLTGTVQAVSATYVTLNGVDIIVDASTHFTGNAQLRDIAVGDILHITATRRDSQITASKITLHKRIKTIATKGSVQAIDTAADTGNTQITLGLQVFTLNAATAIADTTTGQIALTVDDLRLGDHLLISSESSGTINIARTVQRTLPEKTRLYDDSDIQPEYDWGFSPQSVDIANNENLLHACYVTSIRSRLDNGSDTYAFVCEAEGHASTVWTRGTGIDTAITLGDGQTLSASDFFTWVTEQLALNNIIHIQMQADGDPFAGIHIYADKIHARIGAGKELLPIQYPAP